MSKVCYDFLTESFLFQDEDISNSYKNHTEDALQKELTAYRKHCISGISDIEAEVAAANQSNYGLFCDSTTSTAPPLSSIKQVLSYFDLAVVSDPLLGLTHNPDSTQKILTDYAFGLSTDESRDSKKISIAKNCQYMKECTAGVSNDLIKFVPASLMHEPGKGVNILSDDYYTKLVTPKFEEWFAKKAIVSAARESNGSVFVESSKKLKRCNLISVDFQGDDTLGMIYNYMIPTASKELQDESSEGLMELALKKGKPKTNADFQDWVKQSINRAAYARLQEIGADVGQAARLRLKYLTKSTFVDELLRFNGNSRQEFAVHRKVAETALMLNLPIITNATLSELIRMRSKNEHSFLLFRNRIESKLTEIADIDDPVVLDKKLKIISSQLNDVDTKEYQNSLTNAISALKLGATLAMVTASPYLLDLSKPDLFSTLIAGFGGAALSYFQQKKASPSYFLWKLQSARR